MENSNKIIYFILLLSTITIYTCENNKNLSLLPEILPRELKKIITGYTVDWKLIKTIETGKNFIYKADISPDGKYIAIATGVLSKIEIWDLETGNFSKKIEDIFYSSIQALSFLPTSNFLAVSTSFDSDEENNERIDGTKIYDLENGKLIKELHLDNVLYSKNGKYLAGTNDLNGCMILDATTYKPLFEFDNCHVPFVFAPNNNYFAYNIPNKNIKIFDINIGKEKIALPIPIPILSLAFSLNSNVIALGTYNGILGVYDINNNTLKQVKIGNDRIFNLDFSNNGQFLAASLGSIFKIFNTNGDLLFSHNNDKEDNKNKKGYGLTNLKYLKFSQNSKLLYTIVNSNIQIWQYEGVE